MRVDVKAVATEETRGTPLPSIVNGDGNGDIDYLDGLRERCQPSVQAIADHLLGEFGLASQVNRKKAATAQEKCRRPATLAKYPWFTLAHIRDYLRFRTLLYRAGDFAEVLAHFSELQASGQISIVKLDWAKLQRPGAFGWRMIATDIRILPHGMLVEHYMTFREMIEVNEAWLHKVYEKWRSLATDDMDMEQLRAFECDATFSRHAYREMLFDGILREQPRGSPLARDRAGVGREILESLTATLTSP